MTKSNGYSLGKGKEEYTEIWDLIEAQLDKALKSTKGDQAVQLMYVCGGNMSERLLFLKL